MDGKQGDDGLYLFQQFGIFHRQLILTQQEEAYLCYIFAYEVIALVYAKIKVDLAKAEEIKDFYKAEEIDSTERPYDYFQCQRGKVHIAAYRNRKEIYSVVFSGGEEAVDEALQFSKDVTVTKEEASHPERKEVQEGWDDLSRQIGSDEVGVGDFFGPLIVVASHVLEKDIPFLAKMGVNDSKKLDDEYIREIAPTLMKRSHCYSVLVSPDKLSRLVEQGMNIHKVMAKCHNLAQERLIDRYGIDEDCLIYVDQFESEELYRKHVGRDIVSNPLYFRTRGETFFPSVALSSVIARYLFLKEWDAMEEDLQAKIPKGAGALVDKTYALLVKEWGEKKVAFHVKKFFRNYKKA